MKTGPTTPAIHTLADVWDVYREELDGVEIQIRNNLDTSVELVNTVASHILSSGGKRIRPLLVILSARLFGFPPNQADLALGSLVEYIHTATLLHDDVVDEADLRRGRRTARAVWGNQVSILVGDYLYSRAMCRIVSFKNHAINDVLAEACCKMAEGEVLQLYHNANPCVAVDQYLRVVECKTAGLISAACRIGAIAGGATDEQQDALAQFGQHLGIAFQLADDTLDYAANGDQLGKALGQDLRQGKATLPLLHLLEQCPEGERKAIAEGMITRSFTDADLLRITALMHEHGSIEYAKERAKTYVNTAHLLLAPFEDGLAKRALSVVAEYMVSRDR
jgi:octaprenyl-diphosphate synthase